MVKFRTKAVGFGTKKITFCIPYDDWRLERGCKVLDILGMVLLSY